MSQPPTYATLLSQALSNVSPPLSDFQIGVVVKRRGGGVRLLPVRLQRAPLENVEALTHAS